RGRLLLVKELAGDAVRHPLHGEGPTGQVREDAGGDVEVVGDQIPLRVTLVGPEDLVQVGQAKLMPVHTHPPVFALLLDRKRRGEFHVEGWSRPVLSCHDAIVSRGRIEAHRTTQRGTEAAVQCVLPRLGGRFFHGGVSCQGPCGKERSPSAWSRSRSACSQRRRRRRFASISSTTRTTGASSTSERAPPVARKFPSSTS